MSRAAATPLLSPAPPHFALLDRDDDGERLPAKRGQLERLHGFLPESQGQDLALTVVCVLHSLDSGRPYLNVCRAMYSSWVSIERERERERARESERERERESERAREREIARARAARENLTRI